MENSIDWVDSVRVDINLFSNSVADFDSPNFFPIRHNIVNFENSVCGTIEIHSKDDSENHQMTSHMKRSSVPSKPPFPAKRTKPSKLSAAKSSASNPKQPSGVPVPSSGAKIDVSSMMSVIQNFSSNETTYKCSFCQAENKLLSSMKRHIEAKHLPSTTVFNCRSCSYSSKYKHDLKKHYMKRHSMPEPAAQGMMLC